MKKIITYILEVKRAFNNNKKYPYTPTHRHIRFSSSSASPQSHHLPVPSLLAWQSGSTFVTQLMKHLPVQSHGRGTLKKQTVTPPQQEPPLFPKRVMPKHVGGDQAAAAGVEGVAGRY